MPIRNDLRREAERKYLARDEQVQAVMWGVSIRPLAIYAIGWLIIGAGNYRAIICTNKRMLLCQGGPHLATLEALLDTSDRNQALGPPRGIYHRIDAFSSKAWISRRFFNDIRLADSYLDTPT